MSQPLTVRWISWTNFDNKSCAVGSSDDTSLLVDLSRNRVVSLLRRCRSSIVRPQNVSSTIVRSSIESTSNVNDAKNWRRRCERSECSGVSAHISDNSMPFRHIDNTVTSLSIFIIVTMSREIRLAGAAWASNCQTRRQCASSDDASIGGNAAIDRAMGSKCGMSHQAAERRSPDKTFPMIGGGSTFVVFDVVDVDDDDDDDGAVHRRLIGDVVVAAAAAVRRMARMR